VSVRHRGRTRVVRPKRNTSSSVHSDPINDERQQFFGFGIPSDDGARHSESRNSDNGDTRVSRAVADRAPL